MSDYTFPCPRCHTENIKGSIDCQACGIVFAKYSIKQSTTEHAQQRQKDFNASKDQTSRPDEFPSPIQKANATHPQLQDLWNKVMEKYDDMKIHETFINRALQLNDLTYASQQYHSILDSHPHEETAEKMQKRITFLAMTIMTPEHVKEPERFRLGISGIITILGAMLMGANYLLSDLLKKSALHPRLLEVSGAGMILIGITFILLKKRYKS